jgi:hypothetical protein
MFPSRNIEINQPYIHILQNLGRSGSLDDNVYEHYCRINNRVAHDLIPIPW